MAAWAEGFLVLLVSKTYLKEENLEDESQDNIKGFS